MTNLLSTLEKLQQQVSPMEISTRNALKNSASDDAIASLNAKKRIYTSEDDPFNDKSHQKQRLVLEPSNQVNKPGESPFLKNDNILKAMKRNFRNHRKVVEPKEVQVEQQEPQRVDQPGKLKQSLKSQLHKPQPSHKSDEADEDEVSLDVLEEMSKLEECFPVLSENYRLIDKIGEGTFSSVYKAEALNGTIKLASEIWKSPPLKGSKGDKSVKSTKPKNKNPIVALKQIYVTSSPNRIYNELNLLYILTGNRHIAPLLDVLRFQDQVVAILPFYPHADFRDFYRDLPVKGIKKYLYELFQGLDFVHKKGVIHRDLKPTNFLYDPFKGKGVLVDFGLADTVSNIHSTKHTNHCPCDSKDRVFKSRHNKRLNIKAAYPKQDQRPPRRANRAGTRGFRAPEVLFKCTNQSTKIDVWSSGIIGLSLLARKFPLFNSPDDTEALVELAIIFGLEKLQKCSELHGCGLEINLPNLNTNYPSDGNILKMIYVSLNHELQEEAIPHDSTILDTLKVFNEHGNGFNDSLKDFKDSALDHERKLYEIYMDHKNLYELLMGCLHVDHGKRLAAEDVLRLPFFEELSESYDDDVIL